MVRIALGMFCWSHRTHLPNIFIWPMVKNIKKHLHSGTINILKLYVNILLTYLTRTINLHRPFENTAEIPCCTCVYFSGSCFSVTTYFSMSIGCRSCVLVAFGCAVLQYIWVIVQAERTCSFVVYLLPSDLVLKDYLVCIARKGKVTWKRSRPYQRGHRFHYLIPFQLRMKTIYYG